MYTAHQAKEIVVEVRNDAGVLHEMVRIIADRGINILAVEGSCEAERAVIRLVTEDNLRAADALRARNYQPRERRVVQVDLPHRPGMLQAITGKLAAAGIDINQIHGSAGISASHCTLVMSTSDDERALVALNR